jgi:sortase (surface protein transpeptidase)
VFEPAAPPRPARRARALGRRATVGLVLALAVAAGCSSGDAADEARAEAGGQPTTTAAATSSLADAVRPLPPAPATPEAPATGPEPTRLAIESLGVVDAPVRPVGVEDNGEMEIPPVEEVGWYRFGARPGAPGSAVLAAHIAYDGVDGVFRNLDEVNPGNAVSVAMSDGTSQEYVVTEVGQYPKSSLPASVWARAGDPQLVLITCGGEFDSRAGSYEDNVVVFARPT